MLTIHDVVQVAEAQRRFPNWLVWLATAIVTVWVIGSLTNAFPWPWERAGNAPAVQPEQTGQVSIGPASEVNPPAQTETEAVAPAAPVVVDHQVVWTEVKGFNPFTSPAKEGFYSGRPPNTYSLDESNPSALFAWRVFPQLKGFTDFWVAAVREDNITFAWVQGTPGQADGTSPFYTESPEAEKLGGFNHLILSVDGEKSWCELNYQLPVAPNRPVDVWMLTEKETIHLYLQDNRVAINWWEAVINKSKLPCS